MTHGVVPAKLGKIQGKMDIESTDLTEASKFLPAASLREISVKTQSSSKENVAPYRTRWLYFGLFTQYACGGRFMSLYYLAEGLDESQIGLIFAVGSISGPLVSTCIGVLADRLFLRSPYARHGCLAVCVILHALFFTLQTVHVPRVSRFAIMLACRVFTNGFNNSCGVLADAITVEGLEDRKMFGQERLYGAVSWAIMHLLLGVLIDMYGRMVQHVLIVFAAILNIAVLFAIGIPASKTYVVQDGSQAKKAPGLAALADRSALRVLLQAYLSSRHIMGFFVYTVGLGYGMTIVENLVFLLFRELDASYFLCGVSVVVTVVFEIPLFHRSKWLLEKLGVPTLLTIAGLCYSFRVVGYTLCPGGWFILLFEPMHGVTIAASSTASVELVASITPPAFTATGQALLNLIRSGVGSTAGNSIGGAIIREYGEKACYRTSAIIVTLGLLVYQAALYTAPQNPAAPVGDSDPPTEEERCPAEAVSLGLATSVEPCPDDTTLA